MAGEFNYVATCLFGLERLVGEEIDALGYIRRETIDGRVYFKGSVDAVARCNINLRTAERVLIELASFSAYSFTELFDNVVKIPWELIIGKDDAFPVKGHSIKSKLYSVPDCQSIIKKAIVKRLSEKYEVEWFEETGVTYQIEFFILNDKVSVMLDTTGTALHKRGYRTQSGLAPLRETLAAALVKLSRPRENVRLWDPFCGSGTIAIEAALIMTNTAAGISRRFAAESYKFIPKKIWEDARQEARNNVKDTEFCAFASDIDEDVLKVARENIKRAGMEKYIKVFKKDATSIEKDDVRTTIVCNPPYGERLDTVSAARELYRRMGKCFSKLAPWQIYIITSEEEFEKLYGKRADKVRKLYNGMIKCNYYQYFKRNE
ncbi:MAG: class I SAM-dependent RNA methyltransferase [Clostridia bacterium]|nr:class I SAM-dependent RNA methyltransferase [Clostridia bacterium]